MTDLPLIDPEALENLRALNPGDNDEFLREIVGIYLEDTPARIVELEQSLAAGDVPKFTRAAHSIKGSSSNLGAMAIRGLAETLEHQSNKQGLDHVGESIAELKLVFSKTQLELARLLPAR